MSAVAEILDGKEYVMTLHIEDFEERNYSLLAASQADLVRHLMDANGLREADMADVFGTASITSEVLNGKRALAKSHIGTENP